MSKPIRAQKIWVEHEGTVWTADANLEEQYGLRSGSNIIVG